MRRKNIIMPLEAAQRLLTPYMRDLVDTFDEADGWVQSLLDADPRSHFVFDSSTNASMLSNAFGHFVAPRMLAQNVPWRSEGKMQRCVVQQKIALRFKKLDTDLHSMNIPTKAQCDIYEQRTLPNAQRLTHVTFGYTLDALGSNTGLYVVCPNGWQNNMWVWPIRDADKGQKKLFDVGPYDPDAIDQGIDIKVRRRRKEAQ